MQFNVIVVVDHYLGGHFEERFTVIDPHFDFRLLLVHARKGHSRSPNGNSYYTFLSTNFIEHEHPVRINHALLQTNLAVAPI